MILLTLSACAETPVLVETAPTAGPLEQYLNELEMAAFPAAEEQAAGYRQAENEIADCMRSEGFLYVPDIDAAQESAEGSGEAPAFGSLEFAREYGFGISVSPWDVDETESAASRENSEYISDLSSSETEAYREALYGPPVEDHLEESDEQIATVPLELQGCYGRAHARLNESNGSEILTDPDYLSFYESVDEFYANADQPEEISQVETSWKECMEGKSLGEFAEEGRDFVQASFDEEYEALLMDEGVEPGDFEDPRLRGFMDREFEVAIGDAECAEQVDYSTRVSDAFNLLEQEFVDGHRREMDALLLKVSEAPL